MNERVQLTSKFWSIEFSRALLDATQNELLLQNGICFEVAADERREISNDHNPEVSCTISFIFCALIIVETALQTCVMNYFGFRIVFLKMDMNLHLSR